MIVLACCSLHNFLRIRLGFCNVYAPIGSLDAEDREMHEVTPGEWREEQKPQGLQPLERQGSNQHTSEAHELRDYMCSYFNSDVGSISLQNSMV